MKKSITIRLAGVLAALGIAAAGFLALGVAYGTVAPLPPRTDLARKLMTVDYRDLPATAEMPMRDGRAMPYRYYPAESGMIVLALHGSSGSSRTMHALARYLAGHGAARVYTVDLRGHGAFQPKGDTAYIGQLTDDLADFIEGVKATGPGGKIVVVGHSAGGGLALRLAAGPAGAGIDGTLLLAPFFHYSAASTRPDGGWAAAHVGRIVALDVLNRLGVRRWNGLVALEFAVPAAWKTAITPTYSYRLMSDMQAGAGFRTMLEEAPRPVRVLTGADDELFYAERYHRDVPARVPVEIVPGVDHMGLIVDPEALAAVAEAVGRMDAADVNEDSR